VRIEQTLRRLDGVVHSSSDVRTGTLWATWSPSVRLDLRRLKSQLFVWRGAVRFGGATATVVGTVRRDAEGWVLEATGTGQRFRLTPLPPGDARGSAAWASLTERRQEATGRLRVTGEVRESKDEDLTLVVAGLEVVPR
jgi:hypothetical protein